MRKYLFFILVISLIIGFGNAALPITNFTSNNTGGIIPLSVYFIDTTSSNLVKYSEQFNFSWDQTRIAAIFIDNMTDPDGGQNADKIVPNNIASTHNIMSHSNLNLDLNSKYIFSVYLKPDNNITWGMLKAYTKSGQMPYKLYNLSAGIVGSGSLSEGFIEPANNGFYKCIMFFNSSIGGEPNYVYIYPAGVNSDTITGDNVSGIWAYGAQVQKVPEISNLFNYSQTFNNNYWRKFKSSVLPNAIISPSELSDGYKLIESSIVGGPSENDHYIAPVSSYLTYNINQNSNYTFSAFIKQGERSWVDLGVFGVNDYWRDSFFDLNNGTFGALNVHNLTNPNINDYVKRNMTYYGNGWYRCSISFNTGIGGNDLIPYLMISKTDISAQYNGDGVSGIYIYGEQLERGDTTTQYSPSFLDFNYYSKTISSIIASPSSWLWSFGDGKTGTQQNPTNIYSAGGLYTVSLNATNSDGSNVSTKVGYINLLSPIANFTANPLTGQAPLYVQFTDTSQNTTTNWSYYFGDGFSSTLQNPSHTYINTGNYSAYLITSNANGNNQSAMVNITVTQPSPIASFTTTPSSGLFPLTVQFTDTSTNSPNAWNYQFGDGFASSLQNLSHTYSSPGNYSSYLISTNAYGSNRSATKIINVFAVAPTTIPTTLPTPTPVPTLTSNISGLPIYPANITCYNQTGNIPINKIDSGNTWIEWGFIPLNLTNGISIDGVLDTKADLNGTYYIAQNLVPGQNHIIRIMNATDYGQQICYLPAHLNSTEQILNLISDWFPVFIILLLFMFGLWLHWLIFFIGSGVSLFFLYDWIQRYPIQTAGITNLHFLIYAALFILGLILWLFKRKRR